MSSTAFGSPSTCLALIFMICAEKSEHFSWYMFFCYNFAKAKA